jgi:hypothetical protein
MDLSPFPRSPFPRFDWVVKMRLAEFTLLASVVAHFLLLFMAIAHRRVQYVRRRLQIKFYRRCPDPLIGYTTIFISISVSVAVTLCLIFNAFLFAIIFVIARLG